MPAPDDASAWLAKAHSDLLCIRNNLAAADSIVRRAAALLAA